MTAQGSSRVEEERDKTSCGSHNGDTIACYPHRLDMIKPRTRPEAVIVGKGNRHRAARARKTPAFK